MYRLTTHPKRKCDVAVDKSQENTVEGRGRPTRILQTQTFVRRPTEDLQHAVNDPEYVAKLMLGKSTKKLTFG